MVKKKILIFIDWFLPGVKAGGPIKSVSALINSLNFQFDFYIITRNSDFGDTTPYKGVKTNVWNDWREGIQIMYLSQNNITSTSFYNIIEGINPDIVYLNSFFSYRFSILPLYLLRKIKFKGKIILAPRGMLSEGALKLKPLKKKFFIGIAKLIGLHHKLIWHSTKSDETSSIKSIFKKANVFEIQNLPDVKLIEPNFDLLKKNGEIKLIYLGRIAENKNLIQILQVIQKINNSIIELDIYGFIEDQQYWERCNQVISKFSLNCTVKYKGVLASNSIQKIISNYHYLVMLSYSENYGHSIVEALSCGTPVIISNTTPWKNLFSSNAGWDLALNNFESLIRAFESAINFNQNEYKIQQIGAKEYAQKYCFKNNLVEQYLELFN